MYVLEEQESAIFDQISQLFDLWILNYMRLVQNAEQVTQMRKQDLH